MIDLTRRNTIKFLGGAAAASFIVSDQLGATPAPSGSAFFDQVATSARHFHAIESDALLDGVYAQLFRKVPSRQAVETVTKVDVPEHVRFKDPDKRRETFIWNFSADECVLGFYVVRDDDPREVISAPGLDKPRRTVRLSELGTVLRNLTQSFQQAREIDAALIFNMAQTYDATVGGDGVCLCSPNHPYEHGMWGNTFATPVDFSLLSFEEACLKIAGFIDGGGRGLVAKPERLVLPVSLLSNAEALSVTQLRPSKTDPMDFQPVKGIEIGSHLVPFTIWNYLTSNHAWFVLTSIPGLVWFERDAFAITCELDQDNDAVLVTGHEKRKFGCHDPRAVFGSFPPA